MNPGRNFEAMDPLEWLAHMADHKSPREVVWVPVDGEGREILVGWAQPTSILTLVPRRR
jgi:hypothetical protein